CHLLSTQAIDTGEYAEAAQKLWDSRGQNLGILGRRRRRPGEVMEGTVAVQGFPVYEHFGGDLRLGRESVADTRVLRKDIVIGLPQQAPEGELVVKISRPPSCGGKGFEKWSASIHPVHARLPWVRFQPSEVERRCLVWIPSPFQIYGRVAVGDPATPF